MKANRSRFNVAAVWTLKRIEIVMGFVGPFNADQAVLYLASFTWW